MATSTKTQLERLPAARSLSRAERRRELLRSVELEPGALLFEQGSPPELLGLLLKGTLLVSTRTADGESLPLARIRPGETIGEMGILDDAPRSATVRCERRASLLVLDREGYLSMEARADPLLAWLLDIAAAGMARRIGAMSTRIAHAAVDPEQLRVLPTTSERAQGLRGWLEGLWERA